MVHNQFILYQKKWFCIKKVFTEKTNLIPLFFYPVVHKSYCSSHFHFSSSRENDENYEPLNKVGERKRRKKNFLKDFLYFTLVTSGGLYVGGTLYEQDEEIKKRITKYPYLQLIMDKAIIPYTHTMNRLWTNGYAHWNMHAKDIKSFEEFYYLIKAMFVKIWNRKKIFENDKTNEITENKIRKEKEKNNTVDEREEETCSDIEENMKSKEWDDVYYRKEEEEPYMEQQKLEDIIKDKTEKENYGIQKDYDTQKNETEKDIRNMIKSFDHMEDFTYNSKGPWNQTHNVENDKNKLVDKQIKDTIPFSLQRSTNSEMDISFPEIDWLKQFIDDKDMLIKEKMQETEREKQEQNKENNTTINLWNIPFVNTKSNEVVDDLENNGSHRKEAGCSSHGDETNKSTSKNTESDNNTHYFESNRKPVMLNDDEKKDSRESKNEEEGFAFIQNNVDRRVNEKIPQLIKNVKEPILLEDTLLEEKGLLETQDDALIKSKIIHFKNEIKNLSERELKEKVLEMFIEELVNQKYREIINNEEKESIKKELIDKCNELLLQKKRKLQKMMKKEMTAKLREEERIMKSVYEREKTAMKNNLIQAKKEEIAKKTKKIQDEMELLKENYLSKINLYVSDINMIKEKYEKDVTRMNQLEYVNKVLLHLVQLQNCLVQNLPTEQVINEIQKQFKKDSFLDTILKKLSCDFFSHMHKPVYENRILKKEFESLYKVSIKKAFLENSKDHYVKRLYNSIISHLYINYEKPIKYLLFRKAKESSVLKENLNNLSFASYYMNQDNFIDTLKCLDALKGDCKNTYFYFNERMKKSILFKIYLRLAISRFVLMCKMLKEES